MEITNIRVGKQHGNKDRVLTAQSGTKTERNVGANTVEIEIVATNAQTYNGGPNERDEYRIQFDSNAGLIQGSLEEGMTLHSQNGNNYTFRKTE